MHAFAVRALETCGLAQLHCSLPLQMPLYMGLALANAFVMTTSTLRRAACFVFEPTHLKCPRL
jgi:hypothetical protein